MKKLCIPALLIAVLLFPSCFSSSNKSAEPSSSEEKEALKPVAFSALAEEYFLDFDSSSWEREYEPEFVMIHFMSSAVISREDPYNMETIRKMFEEDGDLGINYLIGRDGKIYCYLPEYRAAWHAGAGTFRGDEKYTNLMNKYSIGIELVAIGSENDMSQYLSRDEYRALDSSLTGFTDEQYSSLAALVSDICERNTIPLSREHIIGHSEYSPQKTDPGELFDWSRILPGQ